MNQRSCPEFLKLVDAEADEEAALTNSDWDAALTKSDWEDVSMFSCAVDALRLS